MLIIKMRKSYILKFQPTFQIANKWLLDRARHVVEIGKISQNKYSGVVFRELSCVSDTLQNWQTRNKQKQQKVTFDSNIL